MKFFYTCFFIHLLCSSIFSVLIAIYFFIASVPCSLNFWGIGYSKDTALILGIIFSPSIPRPAKYSNSESVRIEKLLNKYSLPASVSWWEAMLWSSWTVTLLTTVYRDIEIESIIAVNANLTDPLFRWPSTRLFFLSVQFLW